VVLAEYQQELKHVITKISTFSNVYGLFKKNQDNNYDNKQRFRSEYARNMQVNININGKSIGKT
jgi:hypothetical protein